MLNLEKLMSERSITSITEGLTKLVNHVEYLNPKCPSHAISEDNNIKYIRKVVLGYQWSNNTIRNIVSAY